MTAALPAPTPERTLELLRADVREGRSCIATLRGRGEREAAWLEVMGPKGATPDGDWLVAPVPTLRLWLPGNRGTPEAVAALGDGFEEGLRAIEEQARPHVHPDELEWLKALLAVVRKATKAVRPRVPCVGDGFVEHGVPLVRAWASCLTLADLEAAVRKAAA